MGNQKPCVLVAGDVCIDWLSIEMEPKEDGPRTENWRLRGGRNMFAHRGGAWLTADFCMEALRGLAEISVPARRRNIAAISPDRLIHSMLMLARYNRNCAAGEEKKVWGVHNFEGFAGPRFSQKYEFCKSEPDNPAAAIVILDDAGNGYRAEPKFWPKAMEKGRKPIILYKVRRPLLTGPLWDRIKAHHLDRTIAILNAEELRAQGAAIGRRLSWERTTAELLIALHHQAQFRDLLKCAHVIVPLGLEGTVRISRLRDRRRRMGLEKTVRTSSRRKEKYSSRLWYLPDHIEHDLLAGDKGSMTGFASAFVAALAKALLPAAASARRAVPSPDLIDQGIQDGMHAAWLLLEHAFGPADDKSLPNPVYPYKEIFSAGRVPGYALDHVDPAPVPSIADRHNPAVMGKFRDWRILDHKRTSAVRDLAKTTAIEGRKAALPGVPLAKFGLLETIDRWEIESFRSIRNLIGEYLRNPRPERPLCLAVFGRPGSGKSFGVTQVAQSINKEAIEKLDFNLSQWESPDRLAGSLHRVRDSVLRGKVPLVFFDEFDCRHEHSPLGWLKNFLAPMQDGVFVDGAVTHLIGKAIFVFAGGTCSSFQDFSRQAMEADRNSKAIDFLSRLRGHVDIFGIDPLADVSMLRRAMMLRSMLQRRHPSLFDRNGRLRIEPGLLWTFLSIPRYAHGVRSMEAIIEMSRLQEAESYVPSLLPTRPQLDLHTDGRLFCAFMESPGPLDEIVEKIAEALHDRYLKNLFKGKSPAQIAKIKSTKPAAVNWSALPELYKDSNRDQALHFPIKLAAIRCDLAPAAPSTSGKAKAPAARVFTFKKAEIEKLAEMEHERWIGERRLQQPHHPALIPWDKLPDEEKAKDRNAIKDMPEILKAAGLAIIRTP